MLSDTTSPDELGRKTGIVMSIMSFGLMFSSIGGVLFNKVSYVSIFILCGAVVAIDFLIRIVLIDEWMLQGYITAHYSINLRQLQADRMQENTTALTEAYVAARGIKCSDDDDDIEQQHRYMRKRYSSNYSNDVIGANKKIMMIAPPLIIGERSDSASTNDGRHANIYSIIDAQHITDTHTYGIPNDSLTKSRHLQRAASYRQAKNVAYVTESMERQLDSLRNSKR
jgi:hypothetical protein